jgi:ATP-binding cassette, subfamily C (CFTR/MRP), member 1
LVTTPAAQLLNAIPTSAACIGCFERIQRFLLAPEWTDQRHVPGQNSSFPLADSGSPSAQDVELQEYLRQDGHNRLESEMVKHSNKSNSMKYPAMSFLPTISIEKLTVRPSSNSKPALLDITLQLAIGVNMITGPVGSGKTTLMRAILGELSYDSGKIQISTRDIAYCSQTLWLLNTTIRQIICGLDDRTFDEKWYNTAIHVCVLDQDMLQLPHGDQSKIGSGGLTLSGGQKQRVVRIAELRLYSRRL